MARSNNRADNRAAIIGRDKPDDKNIFRPDRQVVVAIPWRCASQVCVPDQFRRPKTTSCLGKMFNLPTKETL